MNHLPELVYDLALILIAAGTVTLLFRRLKQPLVLGYIVAGLLVGPGFKYLPTVRDVASIRVWAELGVIFLLFALGLEFSFKKLARVGGAATVTAVTEVVSMVIIGFCLGLTFGWSKMDSLFLGGTLAISSTTIIIRAFDEIGVKTRGFANLVFGVLIIEDLVAILLLVLLATVAATHSFAGKELVVSMAKLAFFLILWFVGGILLVPSLLRRLRHLVNGETLLVIALALCFLMVVLASQAGFSPALGAFIMGSLLAETSEGERIEKAVTSVKDLFAAIFFVSVGMMIDPAHLIEYAWPIAVITVVTIVGKTFSTTIGALLSGQSIRHSVQSGMSLAQIGEFSFIIAALGLQLKVTSDFLYPIIVGVSAVTTFTTPYFIRSADQVVGFLDRHLPAKWEAANLVYGAALQGASGTSEWGTFVRGFMVTVAVNSAMITAAFLAVEYWLQPLIEAELEDVVFADAGGLFLAILLSAPFIWALTLRKNRASAREALWKKLGNRAPLFILEVSRWIIAVALIGFLSTQFIAVHVAAFTVAMIIGLILLLFSRYLDRLYSWFEHRFTTNLSESDRRETATKGPQLAPWDAHIAKLEVPADATILGQTLEELKVRERFGVTIALIGRGQKKVLAPNRHERLFPNDQLAVIGTDEQIAAFKTFLGESAVPDAINGDGASYSLHPFRLGEDSACVGRTIRDSGIREKCHGLVVGIERTGERILNPDSGIRLEANDLLWIVADDRLFKQL